MSNLTVIRERVATIQKAITLPYGATTLKVNAAKAYQPSDISSLACPFFINELRGGRAEVMATGGLQYIDSNISMNLCVARKEANLGLDTVLEKTEQWRDTVLAAFALKIRLGNDLDFIIDAYINAWDEIEYAYGSAVYVALTFNLYVREAFVLTYAP